MVPGVGWVSCAGMQAAAFAVRSEQKIGRSGWRGSARSIAADAVVSAMTFGVGRVPVTMAKYGTLGRFTKPRATTAHWNSLRRGEKWAVDSIGLLPFVATRAGFMKWKRGVRC